MSILSKGHKPDNYQSHKYLKMSFANVSSLYSNFAECKSLLESSSPDIFALWETKLDDSIDSSNFSVRFYLPLVQKDSVTHILGLAVYVKERFLFCTGLISRKLCGFLLMFLTGFIWLSFTFVFPLSITFFVFMHDFWCCFVKHRWSSLN